MSRLFYATNEEDSFGLILKANSEEEALDIAADYLAENHLFLLEEITSFVLSEGLIRRFFKDEKGSFLDDYTYKYRDDIAAMGDEAMFEYTEKKLEMNIREFWKDTPHFAEEYLGEYQKSLVAEDWYNPTFSKEFLTQTIKLMAQNFEDYQCLIVKEIVLSDGEAVRVSNQHDVLREEE